MLQETIPGTRAMAQRWHNAERRGEETLREIAGLTESESATVWRVYLHIGAARADPVMGQPEWKHGAFLAPDMIRRALAVSGEAMARAA